MSLRSLSFGLAIASADAANYAVITAGSNYYSNYRHQADACHAYQVVRAKGIPAENIIMMMYDDIANAPDNPFPGKLFNKPGDDESGDVYAGCEIDYRGADVTPENFLAVLTGTASGKKLQSTAEDNVFIYFVDHGGNGLMFFPSTDPWTEEALHKVQLQNALQQMRDTNMFKKLVFYLETCYSGSMFEDMSIPNVYALSAANPDESSWATYCGRDAVVNGKNVNACLGDLFSVAWMEDSEAHDLSQETLDDQFESLLSRVVKSNVMQWGDTNFTSDHVSDFIGSAWAQQKPTLGSSSDDKTRHKSSVDSVFTDIHNRYVQYVDLKPSQSQARLVAGTGLYAELKEQLGAEIVFRRLVDIAYPGDLERQEHVRNHVHKPLNMKCELKGHRAFREHCAGEFDTNKGFALQFHQYVVNVCHDIAREQIVLDIEEAAAAACQDLRRSGLALSGMVV